MVYTWLPNTSQIDMNAEETHWLIMSDVFQEAMRTLKQPNEPYRFSGGQQKAIYIYMY